MNPELLQKYISGNATEAEKLRVVEWILASPDNMREYMAQRKLCDIALWRTDLVDSKLQRRKRLSLRSIGWELAKVAAVVALVLGGVYYWQQRHCAQDEDSFQSIYVPAGQRAELTLADGTKVWLNSRTTLAFPGDFKGDTRMVKLDGEGYFDVVRNTEQPFVVATNKYNVKVLGTEFNVMAYSTDSIWETALLKGKVEILTSGTATNGMTLEPHIMAALKGDRLVKSPIEDTDHFRWREGLLCFNNISVRDMIEKLKLYYGVDIVVNNQRILTNRYTGKFRTKDGVEHVLRVLRLSNQFTYIKDDENNVITIN